MPDPGKIEPGANQHGFQASQRIPRRKSPRPTGRPPGSRDLRGRARWVGQRAQRTSSAYQSLSAEFGARLRRLREECGVAASELAAAVGMSTWSILRLERGYIPAVHTLLAISIALGCTLVDLLPERAHSR